MVRTRSKRHRWHGKTLKSNDPLIVSAGWRRFQTQPVFALEDPNERQRCGRRRVRARKCVGCGRAGRVRSFCSRGFVGVEAHAVCWCWCSSIEVGMAATDGKISGFFFRTRRPTWWGEVLAASKLGKGFRSEGKMMAFLTRLGVEIDGRRKGVHGFLAEEASRPGKVTRRVCACVLRGRATRAVCWC